MKRSAILIASMAALGGLGAYVFGRTEAGPGSGRPAPRPTARVSAPGGATTEPFAALGPDVLRCLAAPGPYGAATGGERAERAAGVAAVARRVERLRALRFRRLPRAEHVGPLELERRVEELTRRSYAATEARADERLLVALGAIEPGSDLRAELEALITSQVAAFYAPETGELVAGRFAGELGALEEVTLAHELEHALADQRLGLPVGERAPPAAADAQLAALALVEGDATLTMERYALAYLSLGEQLSLGSDPGVATAAAAFEEVPYYLGQMFRFPYFDGLAFVCALYLEGGWDAIERAYARPPETTAQVLFPERYLGDERAAEVPPIAAPPGWRVVRRGAFGAAPLLWLFQAPGGDPRAALPRARRKAAEWGGGAYTQLRRGGRHALSLVLVDRPGGGELCRAVVQWYARTFPDARQGGGPALLTFAGERHTAIACHGTEVRLGIAPGAATARTLARP